jgi:hypothetical protein
VLCACALAAGLAPDMRGQDAPAAASSVPHGITVAESEQIFDTLCALDAAGFNVNENTLGDMPGRVALRADLLRQQGPATDAVRSYYRGHPVADPNALVSRYITFALTLGPPPDFSFQVSEDEMPPEALAFQDFQPLLAAFYQEANLGARWQKIEPEYANLSSSYQSILRGVVVKTNSYLREIVQAQNGRSFTVYVEPLSGNHTNFRNIGDHYAVVVGTKPSDSADEIQHAYLHFILDPIVLKNLNKLEAKRPLLDIAGHAPELPDEFRSDLTSFVDECVIKSVELRLRELPAAQEEAILKQDDESGYVMVRPLVAGLKNFEKDNPSMTYYLADLLASVNVAAETKRLESVTFASGESAPTEASAAAKATAGSASDKDQLLAQGDREIAQHNGAAAAEIFNQILAAYPNEPHALYGLAVASVLQGHADESKALFEKIVANAQSTGPAPAANNQSDATVLAWSHVYLGRIHDLEGDRDLATKEYRDALSVAGAPESARIAAQHGVDQAYEPPARQGAPNSQPQ